MKSWVIPMNILDSINSNNYFGFIQFQKALLAYLGEKVTDNIIIKYKPRPSLLKNSNVLRLA